MQFNYLPELRGLFALKQANPREALKSLQAASPYEFAVPGLTFLGCLYPDYVRGQSYLDLHQDPEAAAEFQKILDHRGLIFADPIGALAHLQLGRAYASTGDTTRANTAYQDIPTPCKDAGPDVPG